jgi:hypothetical protein
MESNNFFENFCGASIDVRARLLVSHVKDKAPRGSRGWRRRRAVKGGLQALAGVAAGLVMQGRDFIAPVIGVMLILMSLWPSSSRSR